MNAEQKKSLTFGMLVFREVARLGSFTAAALALGITKSGASQHVSQLEKALGLQLMVRTTRSLGLTAAGHALLARADELNNLLDLASEEAQGLSQRPKGPLRLAGPNALAQGILLPALQELVARFPGIEPDVLIDDAVVDLVQGGIDLAVRVGELADSSLRAKPVGALRGVPVASPRYLASAPSITCAADLAVHPFVAARWQHTQHELRLYDALDQLHTVHCPVRHKFDTATLSCDWVARGNGFAVLPDVQVHDALATGSLVQVLPLHERSQPVYTLHRYQGAPPLAVRWLQTLIEQRLAQAGAGQGARH
jgi:DNA-binding transcriptional LysR family regulator